MKFFGAKISNFKWLSRKSYQPDAFDGFSGEEPGIRVSKTITGITKGGRDRYAGTFTINKEAMKELNLVAGDKIIIGVDTCGRKVAFKKTGDEGYTLSGTGDKKAGLTTAGVRGQQVKSTVKFQATKDYLDLVNKAFYVNLSDCEVEGDTVIIPCPRVEQNEEPAPTPKKIGRPRKYNPSDVQVSDNEGQLFKLAMEYAKENDTSFEKAFSHVIKTEVGSKLYLDIQERA